MNTIDNMYIDILTKTFFACLLSGFIGIERQIKDRPAGFRTHILVCVGSMSVMILSNLVVKENYHTYGVYSDPFRMGAQVISGIGFLGAGTIIHYGSNVKGLTTAASLWIVAIIGLIVGSGYYFLATTITVTISVILLIFNGFSRRIILSGNVTELIVEMVNNPKTLGATNFIVGRYGGQILDMKFLEEDIEDLSYNKSKDDVNEKEKFISVKMVVRLPVPSNAADMVAEMEEVFGVIKAMVV